MGGLAYGIGYALISFTYERFPRRIVLDSSDLQWLFVLILVICTISSLVGIRKAMADQEVIPDLAAALKKLLGDKTAVATPESFLRQLGNLFALSDKFAAATSLIVMVVAFLMVFKTIAGGIQERAREIGVLKCLGWTNGNIIGQLLAESMTQCFLAGLLGLGIAWMVCFVLSFQQVNIPIPWEMSPTPHFLPGGGEPVFKTVALPANLSWSISAFALVLSLLVGAITSILCIGRITRIKPSEVLRHDILRMICILLKVGRVKLRKATPFHRAPINQCSANSLFFKSIPIRCIAMSARRPNVSPTSGMIMIVKMVKYRWLSL